MADESFETEPATKGQTALVMFGLAGLLFLAGLATLADEGEAVYVDGKVVASDCRNEMLRDQYGKMIRTVRQCDVRVEYALAGGAQQVITAAYQHEVMDPLEDVPEKDAVVQVDVTTDQHKLAPPGGFEGTMLVCWLGALLCIVIGVSQRSKKA